MADVNRPNALWIMSDQHPAHMLSIAGNPNLSTPNIDTLARTGLYFDRAVSGYPLCSPFRGSMLTSRWAHECVPGHEHRMPPEMPTVAHAFNEAGYHTAYFGKWHVDGFHEDEGRAAFHIVPPERRGGFQEWCGYENNNSQYDSWVHGGEGDSAYHEKLTGFETDALTDRLLEYLDRRAAAGARSGESGGGDSRRGKSGIAAADQPFFAVLSVQPPHDPYVAPPEYLRRHPPAGVQLRPNVPPIPTIEERSRETLAGAYAMVENLDDNVGRIIAKLRELGIYENTHIIFFSDHGDMHGSHGQRLKILPWEESVRVPFIISGMKPAYELRQGRSSALVNHVDIAPTTLGLCGIDVPETMRGVDYSPLRRGEIRDNDPRIPDSAFIQVVQARMESNKPWRAVITRDGWKYVSFPGCSWGMFDLSEDPFELHNMAHDWQFAPKRHELIARLRRWIEETEDDFPVPAD